MKESLQGFQMERFEKLLESRADQIDDQLFDLLVSFSDFSEFKEMALSHKNQFSFLTPPVEEKKEDEIKKVPKTEFKPDYSMQLQGIHTPIPKKKKKFN